MDNLPVPATKALEGELVDSFDSGHSYSKAYQPPFHTSCRCSVNFINKGNDPILSDINQFIESIAGENLNSSDAVASRNGKIYKLGNRSDA